MPHRILSLFVFLSPFLLHAGEAKPRIDPAGIPGNLLLAGEGKVTPEIVDRFLLLAGGDKGHLIVVEGKEKPHPVLWERAKEHILRGELVRGDLRKIEATGLWLEPDDPATLRKLLQGPLGVLCKEILKKGGTIGAAGGAAESIELLLPDALVTTRGPDIPAHPGLVRFDIPSETALQIRGRQISVLGKGAVKIVLSASKTLPKRTISLDAKKQADLTALRRAARARTEEPFPPAMPPAPVVEKGTLIIVGGGAYPPGLIDRFVQLAGGDKAKIVYLPTGNPDPLPDKGGDLFRKAGAGKVTYLKGRTLGEVQSKEHLDAFKEATGVWFGGGRQWRFVDAYEGTKVHELMKEVLARGGVIGGTSAGATIQGDYLCRASPFENFTMMYEGYERGLGFLPGTAIDQHFSQRKRFPDMTLLMKTYPRLLGIGIDEATAFIVQGHVAEVTGKGKVHFYDAGRKHVEGEADYEAVSDGGRYDLKGRKVVR